MNRERATAAVQYGLTGVLTALWGATLPATDARLGLGEARLGSTLLALALGGIAVMPLAGRLAARRGGSLLLRTAAPAAGAALAGPALARGYPALLAAAVVLGGLLGALNVALSLRATAVERSSGRPVISTLHGVWTLGAVAGGAATSAGLHAGVPAQVLQGVGAAMLAAAFAAVGGYDDAEPPVRRRPGPSGRAPGLALGLIGAAAFLAEGAATDWAGVHARRVLGADPAAASLTYTVFFAAMTAVRFTGDAVRPRLGPVRTLRLAGATATAGYALVLTAAGVPAATAGWALAGAGMALVWPVVVSAAGTSPGGARTLSWVTTLATAGGLAGPALIGFTAEATTLTTALLLPAALAVAVGLAARAVRPADRTYETADPARAAFEGEARSTD
ncbi:hypothetical protein ACFQLX_11830 [Streptomyces polyrhachis]|uniref:MFS transporter n=1 Tax=Streptomyces polyrhachis TaxID=1282885 RepID=A0ABW2GGF4_9ACTN